MLCGVQCPGIVAADAGYGSVPCRHDPRLSKSLTQRTGKRTNAGPKWTDTMMDMVEYEPAGSLSDHILAGLSRRLELEEQTF